MTTILLLTSTSLLIIIYILGVLNAMRLWPLATVDYNEDGEEYSYILPERTPFESLTNIYLWPLGCITAYLSLLSYSEEQE